MIPYEYTREELDAQYNNIRSIQFQVALRTHKLGDWIARQQNGNGEWYGWAFIVNRKCIFIPDADVMHDPTDAEFIDRLATEVLGFSPDSLEHLREQEAEARALRDQYFQERAEAQKRLELARRHLLRIMQKRLEREREIRSKTE